MIMLHSLILSKDIEGIKHHIKNTDVNAINHKKETPLLLAIKQIVVIKLLAFQKQINQQEMLRQDSLMYSIVECILSYRPNVNKADAQNRTPLYMAIQSGNVNLVERLLYQGANPNYIVYPAFGSPLNCAIQTNNILLIEVLLENGAFINQPICKGATAILLALQNHRFIQENIIDYLLGAPLLDITLTDSDGNNVLHAALKRNCLSLIGYLLEKVDVNQRNQKGDTPLLSALKEPFIQQEIIDYLIEAGADITIKSGGRCRRHIAQQLIKDHVTLSDCLKGKILLSAVPCVKTWILEWYDSHLNLPTELIEKITDTLILSCFPSLDPKLWQCFEAYRLSIKNNLSNEKNVYTRSHYSINGVASG